ncbi:MULTISPECIES: hypothetical protein [unclassified Janthinobacterium]|uniref:hypothetical protein n=1 Tax=unclassified Janthinobacterium TaxID=2610881 RepID=UPI0018C8E3AF|nr:hypothetical protein [Janthinobacterium sp. CG_23.4]MDH6157437.1 hypothetical protein [Janthinobacterium sp. CG_23.4]
MSIKKYAVAATSVVHLKDGNDELMYADGADGKPDLSRPMRVTLYGPGSKQFAKVTAVNTSALMDRMKKKGKDKQSAEERTEEAANTLAACTASFENIEIDSLAGEALYKAVYSDLELGFVNSQLNAHLNDWANFTKPSANS